MKTITYRAAAWSLALLACQTAAVSHAQQMQRFGNYELHYIVIPTTTLQPYIAARYDISRGKDKALCNLAVIDANGKGVPRNFTEALRWFRKAHAQGVEQAAGAIEQVLQMQRRQQQGAAAAASPPSPAPSSSSPHSPISIGTRVELHGLKAKPELNGQRGVVAGFDAASGRCKVELEDGRGPFKLKVGNLKKA